MSEAPAPSRRLRLHHVSQARSFRILCTFGIQFVHDPDGAVRCGQKQRIIAMHDFKKQAHLR